MPSAEADSVFLIATDVAARGIDFDKIDLVVNYDFPGRTGDLCTPYRANRKKRRKGRAVSLLCESEERMLHMVEAYMGRELPVTSCPEPDEEATKAFWTRQRERRASESSKGAAFKCGNHASVHRRRPEIENACSRYRWNHLRKIDGIGAEDIGIIDIRESLTYVEILNGKGRRYCLQEKPIKGRLRK